MPQVAISADFLTAFSKIPRSQQKKVREFITRFQNDPTTHSINYEPVQQARDRRVRSVRIDLAYRAIVLHPRKGNTYLLAWVDHHDEAMDWARYKQFEINPVTGALQVVDTEALQAAAPPPDVQQKDLSEYALFETFGDEDLLRTGLPRPLLPAVRALHTPADLDRLEPYLPDEAYETLFWIANMGHSVDQALAEAAARPVRPDVDAEDLDAALEHPDSRRRFVVVKSAAELVEMLNAPLEKWRVFLHPSQARLVERHFNGPARVLGGAGTGKTVVAMHRARHLAAEVFTQATDRVLFTTYTRNLAHNIEENLRHLCGPEIERIEVINLHRWAMRFLRSQGFPVKVASDDEVNACWRDAVSAAGSGDWPEAFYRDEWEHIVKGREVRSKAEYLRVSRRGQGVRLSRPQRAAVWEVLAEFQRELDALDKMTWLDVVSQTRLYLVEQGGILPYRAVVVDETQDLHPEELRLLRQIVPGGSNDLFLVGDAHQRIYGRPVVLSHCGINIRGRSSKLRINYRTTEEIRDWAVSVLTGQPIDDLDGGLDDHLGYKSLLHGAPPTVRHFDAQADEQAYVIGVVESLMIEDNVSAETICVVARKSSLLQAYQAAFEAAGIDCLYLQASTQDDAGPGVRLATMHRVKGLEFAHVLMVGVNEGVIPSPYVAQDQVVQERCLLHVAASRARDRLVVTSWGRASGFVGEFEGEEHEA